MGPQAKAQSEAVLAAISRHKAYLDKLDPDDGPFKLLWHPVCISLGIDFPYGQG